MHSAKFFVLIFVISLCDQVISSSPSLEDIQIKPETSPIPLSELVEELRKESVNFRKDHVSLMAVVASYGDRLYDLSKEVSTECSRTLRATYFTQTKLASSWEASAVMKIAVNAVELHLRNTTELEEHPLELFCKTSEKYYGEKNLSSSLEKAKKEAANFNYIIRRPPYSRVLIKSEDSLKRLASERMDVPEKAKLFASTSFGQYTRPRGYDDPRPHIFAQACLVVAKNEEFAESMQMSYEKTLNDTAPEIAASYKVGKITSQGGDTWCVPKMLKILYGHITKDPILKKEVDSTAARMFPQTMKENLDFSKLENSCHSKTE